MEKESNLMDTNDTSFASIIPMSPRHSLASRSGIVVSQERENLRTRNLTGYFLPGEIITNETGFMRGHGTYIQDTDKSLISSVAGKVEPINRLITVKAPKTRFNGEIGDVIIGRIIDVQVQQKRWKVDTNSRLLSILLISSINLPGGELRRKTEEDERMMRSFFVEGDLISAEVQSVFSDGSLSLHTRSLKYGKLGQGMLIQVSPSLIERRKTHFHNLPFGAHVIIGCNGAIWISQPVPEGAESGGFVHSTEEISFEERQIMARVRNCIIALADGKVPIHDTSIVYAYEASLIYNSPSDLLSHSSKNQIVQQTRHKLSMLTAK